MGRPKCARALALPACIGRRYTELQRPLTAQDLSGPQPAPLMREGRRRDQSMAQVQISGPSCGRAAFARGMTGVGFGRMAIA